MPKKKFTSDMERGFVGVVKSKSKPRVIGEMPIVNDYIKNRNAIWLSELFTSEETKESIIKVYGI